MEGIRGFVYSVLVISVSGAVITMFSPEKSGVSKYLQFLVSIVVTSALLFPLCSAVGKLPELSAYDIEFDVEESDASIYIRTVAEQACKNVEKALSEDLYDRFDIMPTSVAVCGNGDAEELLIESISVYYAEEKELLYSDTVNYLKDIFGEECEVNVMYEDTES